MTRLPIQIDVPTLTDCCNAVGLGALLGALSLFLAFLVIA